MSAALNNGIVIYGQRFGDKCEDVVLHGTEGGLRELAKAIDKAISAGVHCIKCSDSDGSRYWTSIVMHKDESSFCTLTPPSDIKSCNP